ncbi:MAG: translation elongation factor Ts [Acidithiobacillus sp.]|uniref:translation elongation factor Ts n=1 Tax=Acidithiobacillus sp. TaxID=1872118 RepID=UPI0025B8E1D6|nr:translation elongation factor Ts [Acidithiobacillus sp.]
MAISAQQVKELRERTGAGMMECKTVLTEADGDMEAAVDLLRKRGLAKADKKSGRVAAEGRIALAEGADARSAVVLEVNCETDFVAKNDAFVAFAQDCAAAALERGMVEVAQLLADAELEERRKTLVSQLGENIALRRLQRLEVSEGRVGSYLHGNRIGVLVALEGSGASEELGRDLAMHVAASRPEVAYPEQVSAERLEREKEIYRAQAAESGKPAEIVEKMISGRMSKFVNEIALVGQAFVKDPDRSVGDLLKAQPGLRIAGFVRFEVGEGIEKNQGPDFATEVMSQVRGA